MDCNGRGPWLAKEMHLRGEQEPLELCSTKSAKAIVIVRYSYTLNIHHIRS